MDWPPQNGAQKREVVDFTWRRRWLRRRRQDLTRPSPLPRKPLPPPSDKHQLLVAQLQLGLSAVLPGQVTGLRQVAMTSLTVGLVRCTANAAEKKVQRTLLGIVQPGDSIPVPYGWQKAGNQLAVWPVLDTERPDTHGWSLGASDGDHNIRVNAMDEGLTRLVASLPTDEAESKGIATSDGLQGGGSCPPPSLTTSCLSRAPTSSGRTPR
ncbi:hypothetical protein WJX82_002097 [Trebouxia sp. C0006]